MDKFIIRGGAKLRGTVTVGGAKNAALPILAAAILTEGPSRMSQVPDLRDVNTMLAILQELGLSAERNADGTVELEVRDDTPDTASWERVKTMRASICVLGPLLARRGRARVSYPGGCVIGNRPIDLHIKGLAALGAEIEVKGGYVEARAERLRGAEIYLGGAHGPTVTGTANVLMAATLAQGTTLIENAACEPEVTDLCDYLVACGAKIRGVGTPRLEVEGVDGLHGAEHRVIEDRIEAGTFLVAGAITNSDILVRGARPEHLGAALDVLRGIGIGFRREEGGLRVLSSRDLQAVDVTTLPYPGFPTDLQAQLMSLLALADGISVITEKVFPDRFMHVAELNRLGARIRKEGSSCIVIGCRELSGAPVTASDLRASAGLVLSGLVARGETEVHRVYHIDRGYDRIEAKLRALGADIERVAAEGQ